MPSCLSACLPVGKQAGLMGRVIMARRPHRNYLMCLVAGILAWLVPGAGHVYLGRTFRGIILCICINGLFWAGVALGGVFTVEPLRQRWWFAAQMCTGVSGVAAWRHQERFRRAVTGRLGLSATPAPGQAREWWDTYNRALADENLALVYPADAVARAYAGVAGMLNLMCIFDAVMLALAGRLGEPGRKKNPRQDQEHPT